jgi:hypothetical protein
VQKHIKAPKEKKKMADKAQPLMLRILRVLMRWPLNGGTRAAQCGPFINLPLCG